jgi:hypothetical protein
MAHHGLLMRGCTIQTANTPWYTERGFTVHLNKLKHASSE